MQPMCEADIAVSGSSFQSGMDLRKNTHWSVLKTNGALAVIRVLVTVIAIVAVLDIFIAVAAIVFNKIEQDCHLENQLKMAGGEGSPLAYRESNLSI